MLRQILIKLAIRVIIILLAIATYLLFLLYIKISLTY
jgi:hypothetical protein